MPRSVLILGVGNLLLGDEGVGVHAARCLERDSWPAGVQVVDGGTGGFHLLSFFQENDVLIMLDATLDGRAPGTITEIEPHFTTDFPRSLSAHDIGLRDLVESAAVLGYTPKVYLLTVSVSEDRIRNLDTSLSPAVAAAVPEVCRRVREIVAGITARRAHPAAVSSASQPGDSGLPDPD